MKNFIYILRWVLFPVSCLYSGITRFRNWCYDRQLFPSYKAPVPIVVVGNLTVGGTGKTPHVEYLIRLLKERKTIVTLSRGYGRKTKGFRWATSASTAQDIGDEPLQFYQKFHSDIHVAVGENRASAIKQIMAEKPQTSLIVLDDAFQHRAITPSLAVVLTDYKRLFYKDFLLPTGYLRESRRSARRAQCIIASKCPPKLTYTEKQQIINGIRKYVLPEVPVFFTSIRYGMPVWFSGEDTVFQSTKPVIVVSGIAQPEVLETQVTTQYMLQKHLIYQDHYDYTQASVEKIASTCHSLQVTQILTTEKDFVKLSRLPLPSTLSFFYLPIEIYFLFEEEAQFTTLFSF